MNVFDVIGPVMIGPSSSHTAGAARLGNVARTVFAKEPKTAKIGLYGSFAKTGRGHGTDKALIAGILGMPPDDVRIRESFEYAKAAGLKFFFEDIDVSGGHPNTARISLSDDEGNSFTLEGASIGGGSIKVTKLDDYDVELSFEIPTIVVRHIDYPGVIARVTDELYKSSVNICNFMLSRKKKGGDALMTIGMDSMPEKESIEHIKKLDHVTGVEVLDRL